MVINMEENSSLNKRLVRLFRVYLKLIPMVLSLIFFINSTIAYFGIHIKAFAHIVVLLLIGFVYIASYVLKFCEYHRMFLHYIVTVYIINCYDYYIGIPINDFNLFKLYSILAVVFLFLILYLKFK